tara:strand:- start:529 stop:975 length:447 start_codon:yes stop_codon:yes gene_type:complete
MKKSEQTKIFDKGFGKIKSFKVVPFGLTTEYIKNPKMSQSQRNKAPTYVIAATSAMRKKAEENKKTYELKNKTISILDFAKKVAKANKGKITYKSKSGSIYLLVGRKTVRISDHFILDRDVMNPKVRHNFEIVQRYFTEKSNVLLSIK